MLQDCDYNKTRLIHEMSSLVWFLKKHSVRDAKKAKHKQCATVYKTIQRDLEVHIKTLNSMMKK